MENVISNEQMEIIVEMVAWAKVKYSVEQFMEKLNNDLQGLVLEYVNHSLAFYNTVMKNEEMKLSLMNQLKAIL